MSSRLAAACLGLVVLGIAWGRPHGSRPAASEATAILLASSWAQDGDSRFSSADWRRGYGLWEGGATGVALILREGEPSLYAHSWPFPAAASLLWRLLGNAAPPMLGTALWLGLLLAAWSMAPQRWSAMLVLGGSALLPMAIRGDAALLPAAAGGLAALWLVGAPAQDKTRGPRPWAAGAALAVAVFCEPLWALPATGLVLVSLAQLTRAQRAKLLLTLVLAAAVLGAGQRALFGDWLPPRDSEIRLTSETFPFEGSAVAPPTTAAQRYRPVSAAGVLREAGYLLAGRETGLLRLAPGALLVMLFSWRSSRATGRQRKWTMACLGGFLGALTIEVIRSPGADRSELVSLVPSLACVAPLLPAAAWLAGATLTGFLTLSALFGVSGAAGRLPLELNRLDRLTDRDLVVRGDLLWSIPRSGAYPEERRRYGVWIAAGADLDLVLVSPRPLDGVDLELSSPVADHQAWVRSAAESVRLRFDSEAKKAGTPIRLALGPPSARNLDQFWPGGAEHYYRIRVSLDGGFIPHRLDGNRDLRGLGAFLALPE